MRVRVKTSFRDQGNDFKPKKIYDTEKEEITPELAKKAIKQGFAVDADEVKEKAETGAPKNKAK